MPAPHLCEVVAGASMPLLHGRRVGAPATDAMVSVPAAAQGDRGEPRRGATHAAAHAANLRASRAEIDNQPRAQVLCWTEAHGEGGMLPHTRVREANGEIGSAPRSVAHTDCAHAMGRTLQACRLQLVDCHGLQQLLYPGGLPVIGAIAAAWPGSPRLPVAAAWLRHRKLACTGNYGNIVFKTKTTYSDAAHVFTYWLTSGMQWQGAADEQLMSVTDWSVQGSAAGTRLRLCAACCLLTHHAKMVDAHRADDVCRVCPVVQGWACESAVATGSVRTPLRAPNSGPVAPSGNLHAAACRMDMTGRHAAPPAGVPRSPQVLRSLRCAARAEVCQPVCMHASKYVHPKSALASGWGFGRCR